MLARMKRNKREVLDPSERSDKQYYYMASSASGQYAENSVF